MKSFFILILSLAVVGVSHGQLNDTAKLSQPTISLVTQGNTSTPSRVRVSFAQQGIARNDRFAVRVRVCDSGGLTDATNATIAAVTGESVAGTAHSATKDITFFTPIANATATGVLTISGVVIEGETLTLGTKAYKFGAGGLSAAALSGFTEIDISATAAAAAGTLTVDTQPIVGDTFRIQNKFFTFVAAGLASVDGQISVGADLAAAKLNIVAAINGTDGINTAHPAVTAAAFSGDDCVITANSGGTLGNAIVTTETFATGTNVFDAATLGTTTAGDDTTASEAVTAVAAALSGTATGADGAGDTVDVTAGTSGAAGNIASTETMANGAFGAATLTGGVTADTAGGNIEFSLTDASAETVTIRIGQADIGGIPADYTTTLNVTHAAP